ncbi:conserved hypothetical protein, partial [Ricinus communis]
MEPGDPTEPVARRQREYAGQRAGNAQFCGIVMVQGRQGTSRFASAAWGKTNVLGVVVMPVSVHGGVQVEVEAEAGCQARRQTARLRCGPCGPCRTRGSRAVTCP